jgi:hypothetical protein
MVLAVFLLALLRPRPEVQSFDRAPGDDARRRTTVLTVFLMGVQALILFSNAFSGSTPPLPYVILIWGLWTASLGYFFWVVPYVLYLNIQSDTYDADAVRLARDTIVSIGFSLSSTALLFQHLGLAGEPVTGPGDYLYFAAVTFSTLGYGDFRPDDGAKAVAAITAMIGNLLLGIIVGTVLVSLRNGPGPVAQASAVDPASDTDTVLGTVTETTAGNDMDDAADAASKAE